MQPGGPFPLLVVFNVGESPPSGHIGCKGYAAGGKMVGPILGVNFFVLEIIVDLSGVKIKMGQEIRV